jgi:single-strand DNA-binding protein
MASVNLVTLIGNLGADPELKQSSKGNQICKFSLATERYNDKENPDWHQVTVFGSAAESCNRYLHKGAMVCVIGRIEYREYEDKWYTTIIATTVQFLKTDKKEADKSFTSKAPIKKMKPTPTEEYPD